MRPYAEAGRKTGSKRYLARRTRVGFEFQQVGGIENRLRTVWCRNSSRKNTGIHLFALEPFAWHSSCRATVGNKKVKFQRQFEAMGRRIYANRSKAGAWRVYGSGEEVDFGSE